MLLSTIWEVWYINNMAMNLNIMEVTIATMMSHTYPPMMIIIQTLNLVISRPWEVMLSHT